MKKSTWFGCLLGMSLVLTAFVSHAQTIFGVHTLSYHSSGDYNNTNPGVYVSHKGYTVGTYYNSERKQTYYAGYNFSGNLFGSLDWGLAVGLATGYRRGPVVPMVVPSVAYPVAGVRLRFAGIPPVAGMPTVFHLSIEKEF